MPASLTLAISIISSLLPLVKAGTQAYADIKAVFDAIKATQALLVDGVARSEDRTDAAYRGFEAGSRAVR